MERLKTIEKQILDKLVKKSTIDHVYSTFEFNNHIVNINSIKCYSNDSFLNKENLLLVHGTGGNLTSFAHIVDLLTHRFNIYILDLPGFGRSYTDKNKMMHLSNVEILDFYIRVLKLYIDEVIKPVQNLSCTGFSFGAFIVVEFAHIYPDYFNTILLVCPAGIFPFGDKFSFYMGTLFKISFPQCILRLLGKSFINLLSMFVKYISLDLYYDVILIGENHVFGDLLISKFIDIDSVDVCHNYPVLFKLLSLKCKIGMVYCENDNIMPVEHGLIISKICSNIPIHIIKNTGHSIAYTDSKHAACAIIDAYDRASIPVYEIKNKHTMEWLLKFKCSFNIFKSRKTMDDLFKSI